MAVLELALLHSKQQLGSPNKGHGSNHTIPPDLVTRLQNAATLQANFSTFPVSIYQCHEHPDDIYLLGGWGSLAAHTQDWITGETNQRLLAELGEFLEVGGLAHYELEEAWVRRVCGADKVWGICREIMDEVSATGGKRVEALQAWAEDAMYSSFGERVDPPQYDTEYEVWDKGIEGRRMLVVSRSIFDGKNEMEEHPSKAEYRHASKVFTVMPEEGKE